MKKIFIVLLFCIHINVFSQTTSTGTLSPVGSVKIKEQPMPDNKVSETDNEIESSIKISEADSLISYDGQKRIAVPNKKVSIEKP